MTTSSEPAKALVAGSVRRLTPLLTAVSALPPALEKFVYVGIDLNSAPSKIRGEVNVARRIPRFDDWLTG